MRATLDSNAAMLLLHLRAVVAIALVLVGAHSCARGMCTAASFSLNVGFFLRGCCSVLGCFAFERQPLLPEQVLAALCIVPAIAAQATVVCTLAFVRLH